MGWMNYEEEGRKNDGRKEIQSDRRQTHGNKEKRIKEDYDKKK